MTTKIKSEDMPDWAPKIGTLMCRASGHMGTTESVDFALLLSFKSAVYELGASTVVVYDCYFFRPVYGYEANIGPIYLNDSSLARKQGWIPVEDIHPSYFDLFPPYTKL